MAHSKRVAERKLKIEDSAILLYEGLTRCVKGYVGKKYSVVEVLKGESKNGDDIQWLRKSFERICNFAEEARLKQIAKEQDDEEDVPMKLPVVKLYATTPSEIC